MPTWKYVSPPARKADYRNKHLRLLAEPPEDGQRRGLDDPQLPVRSGDVLWIAARRNAQETRERCTGPDVAAWGNVRVLEMRWKCPCCASVHMIIIPESWLDEGKAVFVELATDGDGHE